MIWFLYLPLALLLFAAVWQQHTQGPLYAALERQWPNPNFRRTTPVTDTGYKPELDVNPVDIALPDLDVTRVDIALEHRPAIDDVPEAPVLDNRNQDGDGFRVFIDAGMAMSPDGDHAIKVVMSGDGTLTAAQLHRLHMVAGKAAEWVAGLRQDPGYTS